MVVDSDGLRIFSSPRCGGLRYICGVKNVTELTVEDLQVLACPACGSSLSYVSCASVSSGLSCSTGQHYWPAHDGLARLVDESRVGERDRKMRRVYNVGSRLHDSATRWLLPVLGGGSERRIRDDFLNELQLEALEAGDGPLRVLEVGVGTGANIALVCRDLPPYLPVEIWGVDLSSAMLRRCVHRVRAERLYSPDGRPIRLMMADAHQLPFVDNAFDRVFHVGAIAAYQDQSQALKEMSRVAKAGSPIVVVDEGLDPDRRHSLYYRAAFRLLTPYDHDTEVPRQHLPRGSSIVCDQFISRFYYCLAFTKP